MVGTLVLERSNTISVRCFLSGPRGVDMVLYTLYSTVHCSIVWCPVTSLVLSDLRRNNSEYINASFFDLNQFSKVKVNVDCIASCREFTSKALRYGTRSQGISQIYLHTLRLSANGMNHTCLCLPSRSWYSFTDPGGMEGWVGLGWLVGYIPKLVPSTWNWTRTRSPISVLTGPDVD